MLKDLDLIHSGQKLAIGHSARTLLLRALARDTAFLQKYGLMDYSLLVAIEASPPSSTGSGPSSSSAFLGKPFLRECAPLPLSLSMPTRALQEGVTSHIASTTHRTTVVHYFG